MKQLLPRPIRYSMYLLCLLLSACSEQPKQKALHANEEFMQALDNPAAMQKALTKVSEATIAAPDDTSILEIHSNMLLQLHQYQEALADLRKLNTRAPSTENKLMECMLQERLESTIPTSCYQEALQLYTMQETQPSDEINTVVTALLANTNNAKAQAQTLIDKTTNVDQKEQYQFILNDFDRENFIRTVLP